MHTLLISITFNLNVEKFPCNGGLHDINATFPVRTATDKFDGGSGAVKHTKLTVKHEHI